jgi:hypothetical protein
MSFFQLRIFDRPVAAEGQLLDHVYGSRTCVRSDFFDDLVDCFHRTFVALTLPCLLA